MIRLPFLNLRTHALLLPVLLIGAAQAKPSAMAPNLAVLFQDTLPLCYDAAVNVNGRADQTLEKRAEEKLAGLFTDLKLKAQEFDSARFCDRVLSLNVDLDNTDAPFMYNAELVLETLNAYDDSVDLKIAVIWSAGRWGGDRAKLSAPQITQRVDDVLNLLLKDFRSDLAAVR